MQDAGSRSSITAIRLMASTAVSQSRFSARVRASGCWLCALAMIVIAGCGPSGNSTTEKPTADPDRSIFQPIPEDPDAVIDPAGQSSPDGPLDKNGLQKMTWDPAGVPDFELTERSGRKITRADLLGRPWAVCFIFTRCAGPCPQITGQMRLLQDRLNDKDIRLVTITVDPEFDTPKKLTNYADQFDADKDKWLFLTGDRVQIHRLINESFRMPVQEMFGEERKVGAEFAHSTNILLVNARGEVIEKFNAQIESEMAALYRALKREADSGKK
jgi:cytochrome oxidase Cu insertion factor (SCO1/SenC/PrrC family)